MVARPSRSAPLDPSPRGLVPRLVAPLLTPVRAPRVVEALDQPARPRPARSTSPLDPPKAARSAASHAPALAPAGPPPLVPLLRAPPAPVTPPPREAVTVRIGTLEIRPRPAFPAAPAPAAPPRSARPNQIPLDLSRRW